MRCTRNRPPDHPSGAITPTLDFGANVSIIGSSLRDAVLTRCYPQYSHLVRKDGSMFVRLTGALYGLPESGKLWYELVSEFMFQISFNRCVEVPCLFHKESPRGKIIRRTLHVHGRQSHSRPDQEAGGSIRES
jgi:hypothetical protein